MGIEGSIDLKAADRKLLDRLLQRFLPETEVRAFGSRVKWTAQPSSDLDLVAFTAEKMAVSNLKEALAESELTIRVDLHIWDDLPEKFRENIREEYVILRKAVDREAKTVAVSGRGWKEEPLGNVVKLVSGGTPSKANKEFWGGDRPWVSAKDMKEFYIADSEDHLSEEGWRNVKKKVTPGTTLILARGMTLLKDVPICVTKVETAFNQDLKAVLPKDSRIEPEFVPYLLLGNKSRIHSLVDLAGHGTGRLSTDPLMNLLVMIPPEVERSRITHLLKSLDDKIEFNRRMNATLEAMARALFQSWFVDFDPVKRNAEGGEARPEDSLFPDSFEDSLIGEIPKGWKSAKVSEICKNIFSGGTPRTSEVTYWDGEFPWLSSGETRNSFIIETEKTITQLGIDKSSTRLARKGCVVIASAGQGHTRGQTSLLAFDSYINQSVVALAANNAVASDLFLYFDLSRRYEEFRQLSDSHSSRGSLTTKLLSGVQVVLPAKDAIQRFDSIANPLVAKIIANLQQSRALAILRDTLLPALLSGRTGVAPDLT